MTLSNKLLTSIKKPVFSQLGHEDIEIRRKIILVYLFSTIGFIFLFGFGLSSLLNGNMPIAVFVLASAIVSLINFLVLISTSNYTRASHGVSLIIISLSLFLIVTGGVENTGPLWTYTTIPLILFLQGHKKGLMILLIYLITATLFMFVPSDLHAHDHYSDAFKLRFIASYSALLMMSWVYEYTAHQTYLRWRSVSNLFAEQARTDVLTGISNRRDILEKLEYENLRAERRQEKYTIMLIDVDHFKAINDKYGHDAGDMVLIKIVNIIEDNLFERDLIGRWGGEEFLIVLPDTNLENAESAAEKIRKSINQAVIKYGKNQIAVSISIGLATSDSAYRHNTYMKAADLCLYEAKARGRNCVVSNSIPN